MDSADGCPSFVLLQICPHLGEAVPEKPNTIMSLGMTGIWENLCSYTLDVVEKTRDLLLER